MVDVSALQQLTESPLFVPCTVCTALLLFVVALFNSLSKKPKDKKRQQKASDAAAGTVINTDGLRRSTRVHKTPVHFSEEFLVSPAAAKTPKAARTPRASKDAETPAAEAVTPRRRATRAAKTEEPPTETEASPRRRGRPPKSPAAK